MNKIYSLIILAGFLNTTAFTQGRKGRIDPLKLPGLQWHYQQEYTFDSPSDEAAWNRLEPGMHAAFGTTDELYLRCEIPGANLLSPIWDRSGWRGERLNAQLLIWSADTLEQVRIQVSNLLGSAGRMISREQIKTDLVRYVVSNFSYRAGGFSCDAPLDSAWLLPDRLEPFERFDLPGRTVRPVWISFNIPATSDPGTYLGTIDISSLQGKVTLKVNLTVQNQVLPEPYKWKFRLDLWQNPWVISWYYHVVPWSDEHKILLKKHLKLYADAGGKYITTYAVHSPWSDNSYMIEGTMIEWIRHKDGTWKFDYSIFDQYVKLAIETGIDKAITVYTPLPWGNRFRYLDEATGNYVYEVWPPESVQYSVFWNLFLDDLKQHLQKMGWLEKTYLGINENPLENTLAAVKLIKNHSRDWKITYAGDWHPELMPLLDDYSVVISSEPGQPELTERKQMGFSTTFYVCCTPPRPNNFVFSPPVEGRFISWYAAAYGYNGFLRWAYDAWPADPVRDARHTQWPAGDCFLVYPGGSSSIRFEKLREGIVDFEKIRILKEMAQQSDDSRVKTLVDELDIHLKSFIDDRDYSKRNYDTGKITEMVRKGEKLLRELSDALSDIK